MPFQAKTGMKIKLKKKKKKSVVEYPSFFFLSFLLRLSKSVEIIHSDDKSSGLTCHFKQKKAMKKKRCD